LKIRIKKSIKESFTPRYIPTKIIAIKDIPNTINGKKVELAVKQIIQNHNVKNIDSFVNPKSLELYKGIVELEL
jgi:acetoacetyl-CoA synthetase